MDALIAPGSRSRAGDRQRVTWLDGIRGAAAVFVVLHHMWLATWDSFPRNAGPLWLGWLLYGHLAVAVFIVVSGFSLALAPLRSGGRLKGGVGRFIRRRAWRILPPYWAALVLSMFVMAALLDPAFDAATAVKSLGVHGLLLQDVIGSRPPNGALWSIAVEWQIYFLFPLVLLVGRRSGFGAAAALATVLVIAAHVAAGAGGPLAKLDDLTPQFFALFAMGVLAVELGLRDHSRTERRAVALGGSGAVLAFVLLAATRGSEWMVAHYFWTDLLFGCGVAAFLIVMLGGGGAWASRILASPTGRRVGLFSYSIYLIHVPILGLLFHFVLAPLSLPLLAQFAALVVFGLPVILVCAYGFHHVFEAPFIRQRSWSAVQWRRRVPLERTPRPEPSPSADSISS